MIDADQRQLEVIEEALDQGRPVGRMLVKWLVARVRTLDGACRALAEKAVLADRMAKRYWDRSEN